MSESKNTSFVITVLGEDRPGIVESLAAAVADHGGNWIESRMAHLAGQFAGIVQVETDRSRASELRKAIGQLAGLS
ncbi:MAG: ACT domain-containing protein, partial [Verrucomicrobiota bacterium]